MVLCFCLYVYTTDAWVERSTWHTINVHTAGQTDFVLKNVKKGSRLMLSGWLKSSVFDKDGERKRFVTVVPGEF